VTVFATLALILAVLALGVSAYFTAAEMAIFSLGANRLAALSDEGVRGAAAVARLRDRPERLLVLLRGGDALADAIVAGLGAYVGYALAEIPGLAVGVLLGAGSTLVFGELVPLHLAATRPVGIALASGPALLTLVRLARPLLALLERLAHSLPEGEAGAPSAMAETELRELSVLSQTDGIIEEHERQLVERVLRLDETKAWDIMTPRVDIFAWKDSLTLAKIAPLLGRVAFSRVPVYGENIDDITGVLYIRDAYQALISGQRDVALRELARQPLIVPGSVSLTALLREFQTRRIHMAIVVDEYGGTDGLVTLEDVLEELVGEIVDEMDVAEEPVLRVSRNEIIAAGDVDLREINHIFNTAFPQLEHRSLNGFLLEELGRVPEKGEVVERGGITIEVLEATETQVTRARLRRSVPIAEVLGPAASPEADREATSSSQGRT